MSHRLLAVLLLCFGPAPALAGDLMFEGYYRIDLEGKPIGYNVQRFEFDPKSKTFESISFLRARLGGQTIQESLKAKANDRLEPISYQYTSQVDDQLKTIDATFKGEVMKLVIGDGGKTNKVKNETYKIPKKTFLSSFLVYVMLQRKLAVGEAPFEYSAVAEEEGASFWGKAWVESRNERGDHSVLRVVNRFKGEKFVSNLAVVPDGKNPGHFIKGEVLSSSSPVKNIATELVTSPHLATEGHLVPNKILITLFGAMPTGKVNLLGAGRTQMAEKDAGKEK